AMGLFLGAALVPACSASSDNPGSSASSEASGSGSGSGSGGAATSGSAQNGVGGTIFAGSGSSGTGGAGAGRGPPPTAHGLDRTMSMHKAPDGTIPTDTPAGHMISKWYIAIQAVETLTASLDQTIRFGLELFPLDPGMNQCITLSQRILGISATNTQCQEGEV